MKNIKELLRQADEKGWDDDTICRKVGIKWITLYRWRKGKYVPRLDTYQRFLSALYDA